MDPETSRRLGIQPERVGRELSVHMYVAGVGGMWRGRKLSGRVGAGPWRPAPCMLRWEGGAEEDHQRK